MVRLTDQMQKDMLFAKTLRIVGEELETMARQIEETLTTDRLGELGCSTYAIDAQAAIYDLLKQDNLI